MRTTLRICSALMSIAILAGCATESKPTMTTTPVPALAADQRPPLPSGVYDVNDVDVRPKPAGARATVFPPGLSFRDVTQDSAAGALVTIDSTGKVSDVYLYYSSSPKFADIARAEIASWHFVPAMKGGRPVACRMPQTLRQPATPPDSVSPDIRGLDGK